MLNIFIHKKIKLRKDHLKSLHDFQKLLGDINWLRPSLGLTTGDLKPLFDVLKGDLDPTSPRSLTESTRQALNRVEEAIQQQHISFLDYSKPLYAYILNTKHTPTAVLWQEGPLRWIHLHMAAQKNLTPYHEFVASLMQGSRLEARKYYGKEPDSIVIPFTKEQIQGLMQFTDSFPIALAHFIGTLDNHYPKHKLLQFFQRHDPIFPSKVSHAPLHAVPNIFTDGSNNGMAVYALEKKITKRVQTPPTSAQVVELRAVLMVLLDFASQSFNLFSDSHYVVHAVRSLETVPFISTSNPIIQDLFLQIQQAKGPGRLE